MVYVEERANQEINYALVMFSHPCHRNRPRDWSISHQRFVINMGCVVSSAMVL